MQKFHFIRNSLLFPALILCILFAGCAKVNDNMTPAMQLDIKLQSPKKITLIQPYKKSETFKIMKTPEKVYVPPIRKKEYTANESGEYKINFDSFMRSGYVWYFPPFGRLFNEKKNQIIIQVDGMPACAVMVDPKNPKVYYMNEEKKSVRRDKNNLIEIENIEKDMNPDPANAGRKQNVDKLKILIKNKE